MFAGSESNDLLANGRYEPIDFQCFTNLAKNLAWYSWKFSLILPSLNRANIPLRTEDIQQIQGALKKFYYPDCFSDAPQKGHQQISGLKGIMICLLNKLC